jgi:multisubunit Na+/H+ antiporter MnhC subunit
MNPLRVSNRKIKILRVIARLNISGPAIHVVLLSAGMNRGQFESLISGSENAGEDRCWTMPCPRVQPVMIPEIVGEFSATSVGSRVREGHWKSVEELKAEPL